MTVNSFTLYIFFAFQDAVLAERKPVLTDEEESGSSTSSCDEMEGARVDAGADSDTASAPSPVQNTGEKNKNIFSWSFFIVIFSIISYYY